MALSSKINRHLTTGEIALARTVFGDSIDYSGVRIRNARIFPAFIQKPGRAMAGRNVISCPDASYRADFSVDSDPVQRSLFIHEMVHVWQHQNKIMNTYGRFVADLLRHRFNNRSYDAAYEYRLDPARTFLSYGMEQQAMIVQDYFLLKHFGMERSHRAARQNPEKGAALQALFEKVLDDFKRHPSRRRLPRDDKGGPNPA